MPKSREGDDMPETLKRSPEKAQRTWKKTKESATKTYGKGERASRTAISAVKHTFEKVGDRWQPKDKAGPSDPRAAKPTAEARAGRGKTYGGVDVLGSTRPQLKDQAKKLGVTGYSTMTKDQLGDAINRANKRKTAQARRQPKK